MTPIVRLIAFCELEVPYWGDMPGQQDRWKEYVRLLKEARKSTEDHRHDAWCEDDSGRCVVEA